MWMLDTALPFDAAVAALSEFAQHFGGQKRSRHQAAGRAQLGRELDPSLGATHLRGREQRAICAMPTYTSDCSPSRNPMSVPQRST